MLKVTDVSFSYGNVQTLYDVSMQMPSGCITAIMGRNGVGKTTLIKTIMGLCRHHHGQIALDDADLGPLTSNQRARGGLGLVPQGRQIFPKLTVEENLQVALQARSDGKRIVPGELYDVFPILGTMRKRRGGDLSGGQQQQLAIARALAGNPKVLLLDEPTEGIQPNIIQLIGQVLRDLAKTRNMTIVLVEQYLDFVREISQRFYVMSRGRVVAGGETAGLSDALVEEHLQV